MHKGIIVVLLHHARVMAEQSDVKAGGHYKIRSELADHLAGYLFGAQDWIHFHLKRCPRRKETGSLPLIGKRQAETNYNESAHGMPEQMRVTHAKLLSEEKKKHFEVPHHIRNIADAALSVRAAVTAHVKREQIQLVHRNSIDQVFVTPNVFAEAVMKDQVSACINVRGKPGFPAQSQAVPAADASGLNSVVGELHRPIFPGAFARATNPRFFDCGQAGCTVFVNMLSFTKKSSSGIVLVLAFVSIVSCNVQLRSPEAAPAFPVEGLWIEKSIEGGSDRIRLLWIEQNPISGGELPPYLYTLLVVVGRNLALRDQTLVITRRTGEARTSQGELLLIQKGFVNGSRRILQKPLDPDIWQAADFSTESQEMKIEKTYNYDVLEFEKDGSMSGDDGQFVRAAPVAVSRYPSVAVWRTSKDGTQAAGFLFPVRRLGAGSRLKMPGRDVEATISGVAGEYVTLAIGKGTLKPGEALVSADAKEDYRRALSKEEVLEKLRKGEPVAREDLIRALGDKKQ